MHSFTSTELSTQETRPRIHCIDGLSISVQVSRTAYCQPRENTTPGLIYEQVEVGFPSYGIESLLPYIEYQNVYDSGHLDPTDAIYPYVPIEIVNEAIAAAGGMDIEKTVKNFYGPWKTYSAPRKLSK